MTYPKGIMLYSDHVKTSEYLNIPKEIDFIVAVALSDMKAEYGFHKHVKEAYDANIPCLALINVDFSVYIGMFSLGNPLWNEPTFKDPYLKILNPLILNSDQLMVRDGINGIIINLRGYDKKKVPGVWVSGTAKHLKEIFQDKYFGIPIYYLTDAGVTKEYPSGDPCVFFSTEKMLSTYSAASSLTKGSGLVLEGLGKPIPNWIGIKFWWYGSQIFDFLNGCTSKVAPIMEYRASLSSLYREIGFVPREIPEETDIIIDENEDDNIIDTGDLSFVINKLENIEIILNKIYSYISK